MTTKTSHTGHTRRIGRGTILLVVALAAIGISSTSILSLGSAQATPSTGSYSWPVKPFNRQHPIRGYFGDPRTVFTGAPSARKLMSGAGTLSFHFGVDIAAPDRTPVYPVRSGRVTALNGEWVRVSSGDGFEAEYWHIDHVVHVGQQVTAYQTVLGRILKASHHVHFSERSNGRWVNPLAPGHLSPYQDHTRPVVSSITFRRTPGAAPRLNEFVSGRMHLIADVFDEPAMPVQSPRSWRGMPVSPALVTWSIERLQTGRVVVPSRTAFDVRRTIPDNGAFGAFYAPGTHQNMPQFTTRRFWWMPGKYLFDLGHGTFDTHRLHNGVYRLVVTATDTRGNRASGSESFTVTN
jgi:peptidase M23-like protein